MTQKLPRKQKKVVLYIPEEDYIQLRIKLLSMGKTVSGWFRDKVERFLKI